MSTNHDRLRQLVLDVFMIDPGTYRPDLRRDEIPTWDSLGIVSLAVGVQDTFGYHLTPEEAMGIQGLADIIAILERQGVDFSS
jgi:acyl carrier protein